jgi:gliding motility-associated-like protein
VCGKITELDATSAGYPGTWQAVPGVAFEDYSDPQSGLQSSGYGELQFVWAESNEECTQWDTVMVTFWRKPTADESVADDDTTQCGRVFKRLRALNPGSGVTGNWIADPSNGVTFYNQSYNDTVEVSNYGHYTFYWVESTGPDSEGPDFCTDTSDPVPIHFIQIPDAYAGTDTIFCGYNGDLGAVLSIPATAEGSWANLSSANISFEDPNDPKTPVTSTVLTADNPSYDNFELVWTENNMGCANTDTVIVGFARIPVADLTIIPPRCFGEPASIRADEDSLANYDWNWGNYNTYLVDSIWPLNDLGGDYRYLVKWTNGDTAHIVGLTVENHWGCQSTINEDTIYEPYQPIVDVITFPDTCALGRGGFSFLADTTTSNPSFSWIDTLGITQPVPVINDTSDTVTFLHAGTYDGIHMYRTYNAAWITQYNQLFGSEQCIDTFDIVIDTAGMIHAEIMISAATDLNALVAPNAEVWFDNLSDGDNVRTSCTWYFGDGETMNSCDEQVSHVYVEPNECYLPFLVVRARDLPECRDTAFLDCIIIDDMSELEVPNIFSPNGDGINDFFQVKAQTLKEFKGVIVNRWGRSLYEWTDWENMESGWDGKIDGGNYAAPGVYYYIIKATGMDEKPYDLTGPFHLVKEK